MPRKTPANDHKRTTAVVDKDVSVTPMPVTMGEVVTLNYDGLLSQSGAASLYAHVGYGDKDRWRFVEDIPMSKTVDSWTCNIMPRDSLLHFCFHDGANHWDNNYSRNWSITIHDGGLV
jgi:hypothetical protein